MKNKFAVVLLFVFGLSFSLAKAQYYVSPSSSDANSGTLASPFKTIQKAANVLLAGNNIFGQLILEKTNCSMIDQS